MTWLKGQTTWEALTQDINRLVCGEVTDGSGNTCVSGDRWVREFSRTVTDGVLNSTTTLTSATASFSSADVGARLFGTGIPTNTLISSVTNTTTVVMSKAATASASGVSVQIAFDTIRTPSAKDVSTGSCSNRTGYFAQVRNPSDATMASGRDASCKLVTPSTGDPSSSGFHRWVMQVTVQTANTVPGTYSTAQIVVFVYDADSGVTVYAPAALSPNAAGLVTLAGALAGCTFTVADASGTLAVNTTWLRAFTATYMRGIDYWPMLYRQGSSAPSFSVAPPGVAGTDYDILYGPAQAGGDNVWMPVAGAMRGNLFHGLGIKTATGLGSNNLYTVSHSMALVKMRVFNSPTGNGYLSLDFGQSKVDTVNGNVLRNSGGLRITNWCRMATTPGSVTTATQVQYWISCKNDGIYVVLNMDPGATGKMGTAWVGAFVPADPTYDVLPVNFTAVTTDATSTGEAMVQLGTQYSYLSLRRRQDGSEGSRDWQTKWMRSDFQGYLQGGMSYQDIAGASYGASASQAYGHGMLGYTGGGANRTVPSRQTKPAQDGKWWLYGCQFNELGGASLLYTSNWSGTPGNEVLDENTLIRGAQNSRWFMIPADGWISGDELTDTSNSAKYFLHAPDYVGAGRHNNQSSFHSGMAVAEL